MNLVDALFWQARKQPQVPAIIERDQTISYCELGDRVLRTAAHLAKLGIVRGDKVALCLNDDSQNIIAFWAIACLGAAAVPIDARSRPAERSRIVEAFPLRLALVTPESERGVTCPKVILDAAWHSAVAAADQISAPAGDWHAPLATLGSSGTTGLPKFTIATHFEYHFHTISYLEVVPPGRHRYLSALPLYFAAGRLACVAHLLRGDTLIFHPALASPEEFVGNILHHKITASFVGPSTMRQLLSMSAGGDRPVLPEIDLLISGGAPLFADERLDILAKVTPRFCEMYGTAAMGATTALRGEEIRERPASVGRPFAYIDAEIVDDNDRPVGHGIPGHLRCRGPGLTTPVTFGSDAPSRDFRDGWYYSGEVAAVDELGYVFLQGRTSEVIFRRGYKVYPTEIEAVLQEHEGVAEAVVIGRSLPNNEQEPVAYVVAKKHVTAGELLGHCRTKLTPFKVPREIHIVASFPRNPSGKVDKRALAG